MGWFESLESSVAPNIRGSYTQNTEKKKSGTKKETGGRPTGSLGLILNVRQSWSTAEKRLGELRKTWLRYSRAVSAEV